ncbi:MAG: hypothetical protein EOL86_01520 [Deltaproteobacteria bacterium]|nr:hypothetical protein [Deltaproteobacteria bacterium]
MTWRTCLVWAQCLLVVSGAGRVLADNSTGVFALHPVVVTDSSPPPSEGRTVIDRQALEHRPGLQGDANEAVRTAPGVQFSDVYRSSDQGGEIAPARMSISGGRTYENVFLIDGMSATSLLDPDSEASPTDTTRLSDHPQLFYLSPELLAEAAVYSSNIPARLGGFTGGVMQGTLRFPDSFLWGTAKYWTTRSAWTSLHSDDEEFDSSTSPRLQPEFVRQNGDFMINVPVTDTAAVLGAVSVRHSSIPLEREACPDEESRLGLNTLLKYGALLPDGGRFHFDFLYAPYRSVHYMNQQRDSEVELTRDSWRLQAGRDWTLGFGDLDLRLGYQDFTSSRDAGNELKSWLNTASKSWGDVDDKYSIEGSYGDLEMTQRTLSTSLDARFRAMEWAGFRHALAGGLDLEHVRGTFERSETAYVYYSPKASSSVWDPTGSQTDSVDKEQYFSKRSVYDADSVSADMNILAVYVEDEIGIDRLMLRPGVRLSYDDFLENVNLSPRLAAEYDLFADKSTILIGGLNRYHGQGLMTYKLREARKELRREERSPGAGNAVYPERGDEDGYWRASDASTSKYRFSSLDTPYSDEAVLGFDQSLAFGANDWGRLSVRWINRWYEDEFARERIEDADGEFRYILNNNGSSRYQGLTGTWSKEWRRHALELNLTVQETITSHESYDSTLDDEALDEKVWYDGDLVDKIDLPRTNFNRPWVASLVYTAKLPLGFSFSNVTWARAGYRAVVRADDDVTVDGEDYDVYERVNREPVYTFDWKLTWDAPVTDSQILTLGLEVLNVFDARIPVADSEDSYELGRQFWLGMEYRF